MFFTHTHQWMDEFIIEDLTDKKAVKCQKYKSQKCYLKKNLFFLYFLKRLQLFTMLLILAHRV